MLLLGVCAIALQSCYKTNPSESINLPVVAAYLVPGNMVTVNLYQQKNVADTAKYGLPITGQTVYVSDGVNKVLLTETAKGVYTYSSTTFVVTGKTYTLQFSYAGARSICTYHGAYQTR